MILLIGIIMCSVVRSESCSELDSSEYANLNLMIRGNNYTEEIIYQGDFYYLRINYLDYFGIISNIYKSDSKFVNVVLVEEHVNLTLQIFGNGSLMCEENLPIAKYKDLTLAEGFDGSLVLHSLSFPYLSDLTLKLMHGEDELLQEEVDLLLCDGNGVCDGFEDYNSCSVDCSVNDFDGLCILEDDGLCDPDCSNDLDCTQFCNNDMLDGNEFFIDFGGSCGIDDLEFCSNGEYDSEVEDGIDCGGYCEDECVFDLKQVLRFSRMYVQEEVSFVDFVSKVYWWV